MTPPLRREWFSTCRDCRRRRLKGPRTAALCGRRSAISMATRDIGCRYLRGLVTGHVMTCSTVPWTRRRQWNSSRWYVRYPSLTRGVAGSRQPPRTRCSSWARWPRSTSGARGVTLAESPTGSTRTGRLATRYCFNVLRPSCAKFTVIDLSWGSHVMAY